METVIREGTLRLQTSDTSCDVVLNCQGHRLMAHKLILSIASPVLRDLLASRTSESTVLIFPDVTGNTMSLILDYIYTGSVVLYTHSINEFLSVAHLLKLQLDEEYLNKPKYKIMDNRSNTVYNKSEEAPTDIEKPEIEVYSRKNQKKLPNLVPIHSSLDKRRTQKSLCDHVLPSPWRPIISTIMEDPKKGYPVITESQIPACNRNPSNPSVHENDTNNNFHLSPDALKLSTFFPTTIQENYFPLDFHMFNQFPREGKNSNSIDNNTCTDERNHIEEGTMILSEERFHSSDSNKSFSPIRLKSVGEEQSNLSRISSEADDENISVGEENQDLEDLRDRNDQEYVGKISRGIDSVKNKQFNCEDCGKSFSQLRNYKYHRSVHEGTKEFAAKCQECGKVFNDRGYLSSHMKIHRDKKEYACSHCPKRFNQRVAYNMHLRIHTGIKPHECQTCGKSFSRKMLLKQHQRVHTGERPYSCPECGKTFADRSNMSLHARLHTGVKPYACSLCPKSFTKKHHLKTHMNFHTGLKPYSCQKCGLSFSQSSNMRTHYKKCILKGTPSSSQTNDATLTETSNFEMEKL